MRQRLKFQDALKKARGICQTFYEIELDIGYDIIRLLSKCWPKHRRRILEYVLVYSGRVKRKYEERPVKKMPYEKWRRCEEKMLPIFEKAYGELKDGHLSEKEAAQIILRYLGGLETSEQIVLAGLILDSAAPYLQFDESLLETPDDEPVSRDYLISVRQMDFLINHKGLTQAQFFVAVHRLTCNMSDDEGTRALMYAQKLYAEHGGLVALTPPKKKKPKTLAPPCLVNRFSEQMLEFYDQKEWQLIFSWLHAGYPPQKN